MVFPAICALSTPPGRSAIAVIRISGGDCLQKITSIFEPAFLGKYRLNKNHRKALYGYLVEPLHLASAKTDLTSYRSILEKYIIDEIILIPFVSPNSYTGEDYVEIHCHGNPVIIERIFEILYMLGMNLAMPGEFTKRAVLNHKISLYEADAIRELIDSHSRQHLQKIFLLKTGVFQNHIFEFRSLLLNAVTDWISELDFIDQNISFLNKNEKIKQLESLIFCLEKIIEHSISINFYKKLYSLVICGETNTGKSSLFNYLLGYNRSIISSTDGTTRDYIEGDVVIGGYQVTCFDTAGMRGNTKDLIEKEGMRRSVLKQDEADILLLMINGSNSFLENMNSILQWDILLSILDDSKKLKPVVFLVNKKDILDSSWNDFLDKELFLYSFFYKVKDMKNNSFAHIDDKMKRRLENIPVLFISVEKEEGISDLLDLIAKNISAVDPISDGIIFSAWQKELLMSIKKHLEDTLDLIYLDELPELIVSTIQLAIKDLEVISGEISTEDLLSRVFSRFCIGK